MKTLRIGAGALAVVFVLAIARLTQLENGGPAHAFVMLPGQEPATMYLPGPGHPFYDQFPKPVSERPPAVVLIHGFSSDRVIMSTLARRLAENGYAVLAIDVRGHGENRNPFNGDEFDSSGLREDVRRAVDYLRTSNFVDGSRIVVIGHSMGAGAALDYATNDATLRGAVMISGGWTLGPARPKNALFIFAENDPVEPIQDTSRALAAHLAGVPQIELGKIYGDFAQSNAVEAIQVPGVNHVTIMSSPEAATDIVKWLDSAYGTHRSGAIELKDPRRAVARLALLLFAILLVPLGRICGSIAPSWPQERPGPSAWIGLVMLVGALLAAMPLAAQNPAAFVPLVVGDLQISWFGVAGLIMIGAIALWHMQGWERIREGIGAAIGAGAIGFAAVYVAQVAMSVMLHHLSLSPERLIAMAMAAVLLLPFWAGFELLVRRGGTAASTGWAIVGRLLILIMMAVGVSLRVLPFVLMLVMPIIGIALLFIEVFAAAAYSASRNLTVIVVFETLWFAWMIAATSPITLMF